MTVAPDNAEMHVHGYDPIELCLPGKVATWVWPVVPEFVDP